MSSIIDRPDAADIRDAAARAADPDTARRVAGYVLDEMADTFYVLAFLNACDACSDAGTPHPYAPGPGGSYDECAAGAPEPEGLRAECERRAVALYAGILQTQGGYDPAPALVRWVADGNRTTTWWQDKTDDRAGRRTLRDLDTEAAARCWGHYAVMSAVGHGVSWGDDHEPLTTEDGEDLLSVGQLHVPAETPEWVDAWTIAARDKRDADAAPHLDDSGEE